MIIIMNDYALVRGGGEGVQESYHNKPIQTFILLLNDYLQAALFQFISQGSYQISHY